jgi:hypothetical protein
MVIFNLFSINLSQSHDLRHGFAGFFLIEVFLKKIVLFLIFYIDGLNFFLKIFILK